MLQWIGSVTVWHISWSILPLYSSQIIILMLCMSSHYSCMIVIMSSTQIHCNLACPGPITCCWFMYDVVPLYMIYTIYLIAGKIQYIFIASEAQHREVHKGSHVWIYGMHIDIREVKKALCGKYTSNIYIIFKIDTLLLMRVRYGVPVMSFNVILWSTIINLCTVHTSSEMVNFPQNTHLRHHVKYSRVLL